MSATLTNPKARMNARVGHRATGPCERLVIVVARLLAVALQLTTCEQPQGRHGQTVLWPPRARYRTWPMVESETKTQRRRRRVRFYVCPKAATLGDNEPFPVGTVFVVETWSMDAGQERLISQFFISEYAGVTIAPGTRARNGAWIWTTYRPKTSA